MALVTIRPGLDGAELEIVVRVKSLVVVSSLMR